MKNLYERKADIHSLIWLGIYLVLNTVTGNLASLLNLDFNLVSAIPNLILAIICFLYLRNTGIGKEIGLFTRSSEKPAVMLFYVPLLILPFANIGEWKFNDLYPCTYLI